jgi:hypothetical protein
MTRFLYILTFYRESRNSENIEPASPKITASSHLSVNPEVMPEDEHISNVVAIFIVRFDTKKGNMVEWQYPKGNEYLI